MITSERISNARPTHHNSARHVICHIRQERPHRRRQHDNDGDRASVNRRSCVRSVNQTTLMYVVKSEQCLCLKGLRTRYAREERRRRRRSRSSNAPSRINEQPPRRGTLQGHLCVDRCHATNHHVSKRQLMPHVRRHGLTPMRRMERRPRRATRRPQGRDSNGPILSTCLATFASRCRERDPRRHDSGHARGREKRYDIGSIRRQRSGQSRRGRNIRGRHRSSVAYCGLGVRRYLLLMLMSSGVSFESSFVY